MEVLLRAARGRAEQAGWHCWAYRNELNADEITLFLEGPRAQTGQERPISARDLMRATEAFLTSSLDGVRPICEIDRRGVASRGAVAGWLARCLKPSEPHDGELIPPDGGEAHNG